MHEDRRLTLAHGQLGAVLDLVALTLEPPDHRVAGVIGPVDDVDELARQKIENTHYASPLFRLTLAADQFIGNHHRHRFRRDG